jgi:hypothetical protein
MTDKKPRTRADCVADIAVYTSGLSQIAKCAYDAIKEGDIPSIVDCMHKFYTGYGSISGAILSYNGTITEDEVVKYLTSIMEIEKEFKKNTAILAKKLK